MSFDLAEFTYSGQPAARSDRRAATRHFTIKVCGQTIGLPVDRVKTIFHVDRLTPAPLAPKEIAGLANLRGRIVTALHLDRCLWMERTEERRSLAVGVEHGGEDYALLIDDTGDVVVCEESDRIICPTHIDERLRELMAACYRLEGGFLSILDLGALIRRVTRHGESALAGGVARNRSKGDVQ